jgi:hypothetical protein
MVQYPAKPLFPAHNVSSLQSPPRALSILMANTELRYDGAPVRLKKSATKPDWNGRTVLVADPWAYVDLWLRREEKTRARFYWEQSQEFARAAGNLGPTASPLLIYYSMLNAVKALLTVRGAVFNERHGIGGRRNDAGRGLTAEIIELSDGGVFGAFAQLLGERVNKDETYNLKQLLYNLVWIHRSFSLTFRSATELFVPMREWGFERRLGSRECWFWFSVSARDKHYLAKNHLPTGYEVDTGDPNGLRFRRHKRFKWNDTDVKQSLDRLTKYHSELRSIATYIHSPQRLWYVRRTVASQDVIDRSTMSLAFLAMHRLSELARYQPHLLASHLEASYNWLLSEFITIAPRQFIDEIAAEITGLDFMIPGTKL